MIIRNWQVCYAHAHANLEHDHQASCQADTDAEVWQVLNKGQAVRVAQLAGRYQKAAMALCAEAAGTTPGHKGPRIQARVSRYQSVHHDRYRMAPWFAVIAAHLHHIPFAIVMDLVLARRMHYS